MCGGTSSIKLCLRPEQRDTLASGLRRQQTSIGLAKRARGMRLLAAGEHLSETSKKVGLGARQLRKWANRFLEAGLEG